MKAQKTLLSVVVLLTVLFSCRKDPVFKNAAAELTNPTSSSSFTLTEDMANEVFADITWTEAFMGEGAVINYTVEFDIPGGDFSNAKKLSATSQTKVSPLVSTINQFCRELNIDAGVSSKLRVRVVSKTAGEELISNVVEFSINRYQYSDEIIKWGIVGSSVNVSFQDLVYDESNGHWTLDFLAKAGTFVIKDASYRQTTLGSDGTATGLKENGTAIATEAGIYNLDFNPSSKTYTLTKKNYPVNLYFYVVGFAGTKAPKNLLNGKYEIFSYFSQGNSSVVFLTTSTPDFNKTYYGQDPLVANKLAVYNTFSGLDKFIPTGLSGFYYISIDLESSTWYVGKTNFTILGSATNSQPMASNSFNQSTTAIQWLNVTLKQGSFKFDTGLGALELLGGSGSSGALSFGGPEIQVPADGKYDISVLLKENGDYSFSLVAK